MKIIAIQFQSSIALPDGKVTNSTLAHGVEWHLSAHGEGVMVVSAISGQARIYPWSRVTHMDVDPKPVVLDVAPQALLAAGPSLAPTVTVRGRPRGK